MSNHRAETIWHYTTGQNIPLIEADGVILTSRYICGREREAVWFSSNPVWEKTAAKGWRDPLTGENGTFRTMEEHVEYCGGLFRIGVSLETAPHDWNAFRRLSGILPKYANGLRQTGYRWGARISQWYVSFEPVPRSKWLSIENWVDDAWKPCATDHAHLATAA